MAKQMSKCKGLARLFFKYCLFLISLACGSAVEAWNASGHYTIAAVAYSHLDKPAKAKVDGLIHYLSNADAPTTFIFAASWADRIKYQSNGLFNHWHYTSWPTSHSHSNDLHRPNQIIWAIDSLLTVIKNPNSSQYNRAWSLRMLIHLVGDLHQPLHVGTKVDRRFPHGDKNGLRYLVKAREKNLHRYWDNGAGLLSFKKGTVTQAIKLADQLQKEFPMEQLPGANEGNISEWAHSSYQLAKQYAYRQPYNKRVSNQYRRLTQSIVKKQLVMAGYHLALLLNTAFAEAAG